MSLEITGVKSTEFYKFTSKCNDDSYVWMTDMWLVENNLDRKSFLDFLLQLGTLRNLKKFLDREILQLNEPEIEHWIERFKNEEKSILPSEHLTIFRQNKRLTWFSILFLVKENKEIEFKSLKFSDPYFYLLYLIYIELKHLHAEDINKKLLKIRGEFKEISEEKNNLNKYIEDPNFIEWAYSYIEKHRNIIDGYIQVMQFPLDSQENKEAYILNFFDFILYSSGQRKTQYLLTINALKKAWQQKMFRDKGGLKQPYHIPLTKTAKNELKKLAEFKNKTEGILLSELIHKAYLKEMCDENGKALY